jgi:polar amino acid transport system permease protein
MASTDNSPHKSAFGRSHALPLMDRLARLPWWLLITSLVGILVLWAVTTDENYQVIYTRVREGIGITIYVTLIAYALALILGLLIGLARVSKNRIIFQLSTFYVEIVRGVPMLVLLYYIAFVVGPGLVDGINAVGGFMAAHDTLPGVGESLANVAVRDLDFTARAVMALTVGYSAFLSEVFRAGIESIERGQMEAARSLGMTYWQAMRFVILPQAIRRVLPPLGNDFVAMLKDSSLVSVLGVRDITMLGKVYSTSTFRFFETYNIVAFLYLSMTIVLSLGVRYIERRMSTSNQ